MRILIPPALGNVDGDDKVNLKDALRALRGAAIGYNGAVIFDSGFVAIELLADEEADAATAVLAYSAGIRARKG
jgi:hypothetical protein